MRADFVRAPGPYARAAVAAASGILAARLVADFAGGTGSGASMQAAQAIYLMGAIVAGLAAFALSLLVAFDYVRGSFLRWAWILFSGDALFSAARFTVELLEGNVAGPRNALVTAGLLSLLAGLWVTWWGLSRLRLVFRISRADFATAGLIALLGVVTLPLTVHFEGWTLRLPPILLIFIAALTSFLLLRLSSQMRGGQIHRTISILVVYLSVRCVLNFFIAAGWSREGGGVPVFHVLQTVMPWILTTAAAVRYDLQAGASRMLRGYGPGGMTYRAGVKGERW